MDINKIINDAYVELNQDGIIFKMFYDFDFIQDLERGGVTYQKIFFILCKSDFFDKHSDEALKFSSKGLELIRDFKTYYEYLDFLKDEKERKELREFEAHEANLTASKSSKNSMVAAWVAGIATVLSFMFSLYQYSESKGKEKLIDSLSKKYRILEGKFAVQHQSLQKTKVRIDSLLYSQKSKPK
ncbi:hypothetical protein GCM10011514_52940 [Emticicia aquatilis]|uniref:Uncharacterized protein n=2 Tax=Emticicia aquatilis TaxID=1537369 RepID=A0A917DZP2_9BACT|nr:hypothetical protein GCM10011514_52940 [Emticicia aquatilis]